VIPPAVVTVFGGSSPKPGDLAYLEAEAFGRGLAEAGFTVATGGYMGMMEAVSKGAAEAGGQVIGVTCESLERWRAVPPNPWITREIRCQSLIERLWELIRLGSALVALPGGIGTLTEVSLAWTLIQTTEIPASPLVVVGPAWRASLAAFIQSAQGYMQPGDADRLLFADDWRGALEMVKDGIASRKS
jgi:uncharacterized protein (TIGR00730 family)